MVPLWGLFLTLRAQGWDQSPQPLAGLAAVAPSTPQRPEP